MLRLFCVIILFQWLTGCKSAKDTVESQDVVQKELIGTWYYVPKTSDQPASFSKDLSSLPAVRFRERWVFEADKNQVTRFMAGADDRPMALKGTWQWLTVDQLVISFETKTDTLNISELNQTKLIIQNQ